MTAVRASRTWNSVAAKFANKQKTTRSQIQIELIHQGRDDRNLETAPRFLAEIMVCRHLQLANKQLVNTLPYPSYMLRKEQNRPGRSLASFGHQRTGRRHAALFWPMFEAGIRHCAFITRINILRRGRRWVWAVRCLSEQHRLQPK